MKLVLWVEEGLRDHYPLHSASKGEGGYIDLFRFSFILRAVQPRSVTRGNKGPKNSKFDVTKRMNGPYAKMLRSKAGVSSKV